MTTTPTSEHGEIAYSGWMVVQSGGKSQAIKVEATQARIQAVGLGDKKDLVKPYVEEQANRGIKLHGVLGLPLIGLKRITLCMEKPSEAHLLWTRNSELWDRLRDEAESRIWVCYTCYESEKCQCSYCIEEPCTTIGPA